VIADPLLAGAVHARLTVPLLFAVPTTPVGVPGASAGIAAADAADGAPVPITLVAVTVNVYEIPRVSPLTETPAVAGVPVDVSPVQLPQLGVGVTWYCVIVAPLPAGAVQATLTFPVHCACTLTAVGAPGTAISV
jgi:hypothetical protein